MATKFKEGERVERMRDYGGELLPCPALVVEILTKRIRIAYANGVREIVKPEDLRYPQ